MKKKIFSVVISILLVAAIIYVVSNLILRCAADRIGYDPEYIKKMKSIRVGMTEQEVFKILGQPYKVITDPQELLIYLKNSGVEEYEKVNENINKRMIYHHGVDYTGSYLIDNNGRVHSIDVGGT